MACGPVDVRFGVLFVVFGGGSEVFEGGFAEREVRFIEVRVVADDGLEVAFLGGFGDAAAPGEEEDGDDGD